MGDQAKAALVASLWVGMLAWSLHARTISLRWQKWTWDRQPAQFVAVFLFQAVIGFILVWMALGLTWAQFWLRGSADRADLRRLVAPAAC